MSAAPSGGAADRKYDDRDSKDSPESSRSARVRQHRCAGCGTIGRLSLADPSRADQRPVLRADWGAASGVRLLCACCREAAS
jgi:hypothetical protein